MTLGMNFKSFYLFFVMNNTEKSAQFEIFKSTPQPDDTLKKTISNEPDGSPNKRPYIGQIGENLEGDVIDVILVKGERGFGFTIVGGDEPGEMIQINAIVATGNPRPSGKVNFHFLSFSIG